MVLDRPAEYVVGGSYARMTLAAVAAVETNLGCASVQGVTPTVFSRQLVNESETLPHRSLRPLVILVANCELNVNRQ
jgi:hypothetical protein